eukprot:4676505-Prymnesium_polylepis.1
MCIRDRPCGDVALRLHAHVGHAPLRRAAPAARGLHRTRAAIGHRRAVIEARCIVGGEPGEI